MTKETVLKELVKAIKLKFKPSIPITPETLISDVDMDSLDLMLFVVDQEKKWGVRIPDDELIKAKSISDFVAIFHRRINIKK